jgi:outer membrane immunogenic protein
MKMKVTRYAALAASATALLVAGAPGLAAAQTDWSGPYVGVTAGYSQGDFRLNNAPLSTARGSTFFGTTGGSQFNSTPSFEANGGDYGLTAGYNAQVGAFVFGAEADVAVSDAEGDLTIADRPVAGSGRFSTALLGEIDYTWTVRGRAGYAMGPALVYATAGAAAVGGDFRRNYGNNTGGFIGGRDTNDHYGKVWGGGVEWAFTDQISAKAEYLKYEVGDRVYPTFYRDGTTAIANINLDREVVRAGINYRF